MMEEKGQQKKNTTLFLSFLNVARIIILLHSRAGENTWVRNTVFPKQKFFFLVLEETSAKQKRAERQVSEKL